MNNRQDIRLHHTGVAAHSLGFLIDEKVMIKADPSVNYEEHFIIDAYLQTQFEVQTTADLFEKTKQVINHEVYLPPFWQVIYHTRCEDRLIQIEQNGCWGFANIDTGQIVQSPTWDFCGYFSNGYAIVWENCKGAPGARGIGTPGNVLLDKSVWHQHAWHLTEDARCGYIDTTGKIVIPVMYKNGDDLVQNDTFIVKTLNREWGVVNKANYHVISHDWTTLERTTKNEGKWDGFCGYSDIKKNKYFKYNLAGQFLGSSPFKRAFDKAICFKFGDQELRFIEKNGMLHIPDHEVLSEKTLTWEAVYPLIIAFIDNAKNGQVRF